MSIWAIGIHIYTYMFICVCTYIDMFADICRTYIYVYAQRERESYSVHGEIYKEPLLALTVML